MNRIDNKPEGSDDFEPSPVLGALSFPVLVLEGEDKIVYVNSAAEQFFQQGAPFLRGRSLDGLVARHSPLLQLVSQLRSDGVSVSEHDVDLVMPRGGGKGLTVGATMLTEKPGHMVISFHQNAAARNLERQLTHRSAARSVTAMASMLAHEVKNPLAGIRGAAQLLERALNGPDQSLAVLIREEVDRICALVDRVGIFAEDAPLQRSPVNIHEVLDRVQRSAEAGFAEHLKIITDFDPSLPSVLGNSDQLIQVFLNLVKNAAEAVSTKDGEITISTGFRRGVRLAVKGSEGRVHLPLMVAISDNGPGIPDDIGSHLFDPFITTKVGGTGLGLPLVAKAVNDHGGVVEFDTGEEGTTFRVFLPVIQERDEAR